MINDTRDFSTGEGIGVRFGGEINTDSKDLTYNFDVSTLMIQMREMTGPCRVGSNPFLLDRKWCGYSQAHIARPMKHSP